MISLLISDKKKEKRNFERILKKFFLGEET